MFRRAKRKASTHGDVLAQLEQAVSLVQFAVHAQLTERYRSAMDEQMAASLAGAVTNALFSNQPSNPLAQAFVLSHGPLIGQELLRLQEDQQLRQAVTDTLRVCLLLECTRQGRLLEPRLYPPLQRLAELGLLVPGGEAPDTALFPQQAASYFREHTGGEPPTREVLARLRGTYK